jgi:hypothetical protein
VGKVTTPVWVMDKATKLETIFDRIGLIQTRYALIRQQIETERLRRSHAPAGVPDMAASADAVTLELTPSARALSRLSDEDLERRLAELDDEIEFLKRCNQPGEFMEDDKLRRLQAIAARSYDESGEVRPVLNEDEVYNLSIRKGSLTPEQFKIMRDHVVMTQRMLAEVPFTRHLKNVPLYASQHHEKLNGQGYPDGLKGDKIPLQSRILAVADFYEALSAKDRPYKKPMPEETILKILQSAADNGEIDADVLKLLTEQKIHRRFEKEYQERQTRTEGGSLTVPDK